MFDELARLRGNPGLLELLSHYAQSGMADRKIWQDRLMQMDGTEPQHLVKLHGELIAFGWVEQNSGQVPSIKVGAVPSCYRITLEGQRAILRVPKMGADEVDGVLPEQPLEFQEKPKKGDPTTVVAA